MRVLVTGGTGFIGSHTVISLIEAGHTPVLFDNLANSDRGVVARVAEITGDTPDLVVGDVRDRAHLREVASSGFDACIHFAALKAVGESVERPLDYYENNVSGTIALLAALGDAGVSHIVFSSSATVYGEADQLPMSESAPIRAATNPYGWTKIIMEQVLTDLQHSQPHWSVSIMRYFNPVGAHPSGLIGEDPSGVPGNLMPLVARVASGGLPKVEVFGGDYPTPDGTGIRDYIHVVDLAEGHLAALDRHHGDPGVHLYNLGTGQGHSVLEVIKTYEEASGESIPYEIVGRRPGDVAESWASVDKARRELGWQPRRDLYQMCADSWRWERQRS